VAAATPLISATTSRSRHRCSRRSRPPGGRARTTTEPARARMTPALAALLADAVLVLHAGVVAFVVLVALAVPVGGVRGWRWVRGYALRSVHLALALVIALQAWLGRLCPLTTWEQALRTRGGQHTYSESFIQYWLSRLIFLEAPWWLFVLGYTLFAGLVAAGWWRWPPRRRKGRPGRGGRCRPHFFRGFLLAAGCGCPTLRLPARSATPSADHITQTREHKTHGKEEGHDQEGC